MGREKTETCTNAQRVFGVERRLEKVGTMVYQNNSVRAQLSLAVSCVLSVAREASAAQEIIVLFGLLAGKFCVLFRIIRGVN
jgi:hypothetical protein